MKTIKTVKGAIAPTELGFTDIHNHLWKSGGMEVIEDKDFGIESVEKSIQELKSYVAAGGKALVDMQPMGVGRGVNELKAIAKDVDAHVIAITGFHRGGLYDKAHFVHKYSVQQITDLVISEVEKGIEVNDFCGPYVQHSDVLPGLVKAGTSYYKITPLEEKLLEVVAKASLETGIPIKTHTHMGTMGLEQAQIFKGYGVKPEKICIGHLDRNADLVYHRQVLREGVYVQYDCVARVKYHPLADTMNLIKKLSEEGYANRILIGGDWGRASYLKAYNGSPGLEFIPKYLPNLMREYGIEDEVINRIFYANPAEFLAY
ncbi:MAG: phosphotriesterase family protein [Bacillota bacterium]|jgi:predicted metal-dependent phosphotriesterase family hydrolase